MSTPFLMSLRPQFADLIFSGLKLAELRRRFAAVAEGRDVYVYVTSPERVLRGGFQIGHIWRGSPEDVWGHVEALAGVERADFDAYFEGSALAYALRISEVWEFEKPISVDCLKDKVGSFVAPQSWRYVKPKEARNFMEMRETMPMVRGYGSITSDGGLRETNAAPLRGDSDVQEISLTG